MPITQAITPLATPPSRADPTNFDTRADAFLAALPTLATEINTWAGQANSTATAASTAQTHAETAEAHAETAEANAEAAQALAEAARDTATTQAGIATAAAVTATSQASTATTQAGIASVAAATTLEAYGSTAALGVAVANAAASAGLAYGYAQDAASVVQQDLSGVAAAALHRSPNTITALAVYDTSKDSDGGAWTERCQHTSWYNEALNGRWLGAYASEALARAAGGTTADFYQLTTDGKFYALSAGSGTTETFRGNKRDFPRLSAIVAEAASLTIYDLTEPGRPMWKRLLAVATATITSKYALSGTVAIAATQGKIYCGGSATNLTGLTTLDFVKDLARLRLVTSSYTWNGNLATANTVGGYTAVDAALGALPNSTVNAVAVTVLPDAPMDPATGLNVPTIAVATSGGLQIIKHNGVVITNNAPAFGYFSVHISKDIVIANREYAAYTAYALNPGALAAGFVLTQNISGEMTLLSAARMGFKDSGNKTYIGSGTRLGQTLNIQKLKINNTTYAKGIAATITNTFNTGQQLGDIRRTYLADSGAGSATGSVADRCYKAASATITGTLTKALVNTGTDLVAYSGFTADNYAREPYSADLNFGTEEWSASAWVNIPTANAAAALIVERGYWTGGARSGPFITLGIDATNKLVAVANDGTTTRTVTSTAAYNTATWHKVRANYTTDGSLALMVNGVEVARTVGVPLLTLTNTDATLTLGNSGDTATLNAPFPGSLALVKFSATVPTAEQSLWMYEQEKPLFQANAKCLLPDAGAIVDLAYDEVTDSWIAASATNQSTWTGITRTGTSAAPAGSIAKLAARGGARLQARTTTTPGVDVTLPAYGLREELVNRAAAAARLAQPITTFDFLGGFTADTTDGSGAEVATTLLDVKALTYPTSPAGAKILGAAGIAADTLVSGITSAGTTMYISKPATADGGDIVMRFYDFNLPVGYETRSVLVNGAAVRNPTTYTVLFDGFKETVRFGTPPAQTDWVQIQAVRAL